jgi:hypothetical protein
MSAIAMTKNPVFQLGELRNLVFHARSKHIELRHPFIRDMVNKKRYRVKTSFHERHGEQKGDTTRVY